MTWWINENTGYHVNRKRVVRLTRLMGLEAIYPKPRLSTAHPEHRIYPYRLRGVRVTRPNQVWSTDITYVRMAQGFLYLTAILDWFSRYVLAWRISNSLDAHFCVEALQEALELSPTKPEIFNTDQGVQFTARQFTQCLESQNITISMDGRGRVFDNIFIERLWRTVKYEHIYLHDHTTTASLIDGLTNYWHLYNSERPHQSLGNATPSEVFFGQAEAPQLAARR